MASVVFLALEVPEIQPLHPERKRRSICCTLTLFPLRFDKRFGTVAKRFCTFVKWFCTFAK